MKIKSEYAILAECVERGVEIGYARAFKHADNPDPLLLRQAIYGSVLSEVSEYFSFDDEGAENE